MGRKASLCASVSNGKSVDSESVAFVGSPRPLPTCRVAPGRVSVAMVRVFCLPLVQRLATAIDRQGQKRKRPVDVLALLPRHLLLVAAVDRRVGD